MQKESFLKRLLTWSFPYADRELKEYRNKERNMFALGMLGQNLIFAMVNTYLSVFYSTVIFVPAMALLVVTVISRIWDAVNDLLMGTIVDKTHSRWGKCRPYLKYVPVPIGIFTVLMFMPVRGLGDAAKVVFVIATWLSWELLYTLGDIPLWGMTSVMTPDIKKRTALVSAARIVGGLSAVIGFVFEPIVNVFASKDIGWFDGAAEKVGYDYYSYQQGYFFAVVLIVVIGTLLFKLPFIFTRERIHPENTSDSITFRRSAKLLVSNKFFLRAVLSNILGCTRNLVTSAGIYYCMWVLANGGDYTLWLAALGGPFFIGMGAAMLFAGKLDRKFGKIKVQIWLSYLGAIPYVIAFAVMYLCGVGVWQMIVMAVCMALAGFGSGLPPVYTTTMIEDSVDYVEWQTGSRYDGVFLSGLNFCAKLTNAVSLAITYLAFWIVDYTARIEALADAISAGKNVLDFSAEYPDIALVLLILITLVPAVGSILQALPLHGYKLTNEMHDKIIAELAQRRAATEKE